jgi:hypothetical protein
MFAKSNAVLVGEITAEPTTTERQVGSSTYAFELRIRDQVRHFLPAPPEGFPYPAMTIKVKLTRPQRGKPETPALLTKGAKVIVFLAGGVPDYDFSVVDPYFGVQPYDSRMFEELKAIKKAEDEANRR